jgi:hypothetical protein
LGGWLLLSGPHLFSDGVPLHRDQLFTYLPSQTYVHQRLRAGELPQWYSYEGLGVPFLGQGVSATFHPQTLLTVACTPATALKLNLLLAYLFAAIGAYRFSRAVGASRPGSVAGAYAFAFGGYALGMSNNLPFAVGLATLSWVGWAGVRVARKRRAVDAAVLGTVWGLVFLGGDGQSFVLCPLLLAAAFVGAGLSMRGAGLLALGAVFAVAVCAVELLPALTIGSASVRVLGTASPMLGQIWALHPLRLAELVVPDFVPDAARLRMAKDLLGGRTNLWAPCIFAGALSVSFAVLGGLRSGRMGWALGACTLIAVWLAMGDRGGLLPLAWKVAPLLTRFRFPEKYLALFWPAFAPLVALGVDAVVAAPARGWKAFMALGGVFAVLAGLVWSIDIAGWLWSVEGFLLSPRDPLREVVRGAWTSGLLASSAFAALAAMLIKLGATRGRLLCWTPALVLAELLRANAAHLPMSPRRWVEEPNSFESAVLGATGRGMGPPRVHDTSTRVFPLTDTLGDAETWVAVARARALPDVGGLVGIGSLSTTLPGRSVRTEILTRTLLNAPRLSRRWGACFRVSDLGSPLEVDEEPLASDPSLGLALSKRPCSPFAFLAAARPVAGPWEAAAALKAGVGDAEVVWEGGPALGAGRGTIEWLKNEPEHHVLRVVSDAPTALILLEALPDGWVATLDGRPTAIFPADVAGGGVAVPEGEHLVEFTYKTPLLGAGATVSCLGLLTVFGLVAADLKRRRRGEVTNLV